MNTEILANLNCERNSSYDMSKDVDILVMKFRDYNNLTDDEARFLLDKAKDAYYNTSKEILNDNEYDTLEKSLGQENKSYVGSKHSENYTVKHPFMMGSLSKVQIHEKADGSIDWATYLNSIFSYIYNGKEKACKVIVTPKYDGCSFEIHITKKSDGNLDITYSGRGDGEYGKDISNQIKPIFDCKGGFFDFVMERSGDASEVTLRGEVLVGKSTFKQRFADKFANTRAFVSGMLNRIDKDVPEYTYLFPVIYDYRIKKNGEWKDLDWTRLLTDNQFEYNTFFPSFYDEGIELNTVDDLISIYKKYEEYRNMSEYSQDGIVIKPVESERQNNLTERRPADCVAIKYIPMTEPTTVIDIEWNLGKSGEYIPTIITNPVYMDGKKITRASAFNAGYLMDRKISIGTKVVLSLAGDIIPYIYKVYDYTNFDPAKLGESFPSSDSYIDGCHVMASKIDNEFELLNSALSFKIPGFGTSTVQDFIKWKKKDCEPDEFFGIEAKEMPWNILLCTPTEIENAIGGKTGSNVNKAYTKLLKNIKLKDIILSCNFRLCGDKVAQQIENKLIGLPYDFTSMSHIAYDWVDDKESSNWKRFKEILDFNGWSLDSFKLSDKELADTKKENDKIPVILTGEPNNYSSKAEFLKCHPEYRMTGSWKEVKIVFTNSLESNTGKMKKAREKNIEIKLY